MSMNREEKDFLRQVAATIVQTNMEMVANVEKRHEEKMKELKAMEERLERRTLIGFILWHLEKVKRVFTQRFGSTTFRMKMDVPVKGEVAA